MREKRVPQLAAQFDQLFKSYLCTRKITNWNHGIRGSLSSHWSGPCEAHVMRGGLKTSGDMLAGKGNLQYTIPSKAFET